MPGNSEWGAVPAQTRGFLFSDLRGYSAFVERHGDRAARDLLARYRTAVRMAIARFGGGEIRTEGDSFYVVFDSVSQAVEAGIAIQAGLFAAKGESINAGIGIHAGEVEDDAEQGIVSGAVNIAARICAVAGPGEVLVSDTVRALTRGYLDVAFLSRGRRKLKGITDPITLYRARPVDASPQARPRLAILRRRPLPLALGAVGALLIASLVVATMIREGVGFVVDDPASSRQALESMASALRSASPLASAGSTGIGSPAAITGVTTIDLGNEGAVGYVPPLELDEGTYAFANFRPRVTFTVDETGWYAFLDEVDAASLRLDDPSPNPGLNEVGGVAFGSVQVVFSDPCNLADSTVLDPTPNALIEWLQGHDRLTTSSARPVIIGGYSGIEVEASLSGSGCGGATRVDLFPVAENRFYLPAGEQLRVIALSLPTRSLTILVTHSLEVDDEVARRIERLLQSIEVDPS